MTQVQQTQAFILQSLIPLTHLKPENEESKDRCTRWSRKVHRWSCPGCTVHSRYWLPHRCEQDWADHGKYKVRAVEEVRYLKKCILLRPGPLFRLTLAGLGWAKLVRALIRPTLGLYHQFDAGHRFCLGQYFGLAPWIAVSRGVEMANNLPLSKN